jgi:histidinol-phosphate aminotransferase
MYKVISALQEKTCRIAEQDNFVNRVENIFPLINAKTKLIFIDNPCNPTGTMIPHHEVEHLMENISPDIHVVLDEAYSEYVTDTSYPESLKLFDRFQNLVILHSFSKMYGMAGMRVGYAIASPETIQKLKTSRIPYPLNYLATHASIAAMQDELFVSESKRKNEEERNFLYAGLKDAGFKTIPSQANFLYMYFDNDKEMEELHRLLLSNNILTCDLSVFGLSKSLRIGIADRVVNEQIIRCAVNSLVGV